MPGNDRRLSQAQRAACYLKLGKFIAQLPELPKDSIHPYYPTKPQAIAAFDMALTLDPKYAEAYTSRGHCREAIGDHKGAQAKQIK